MDFQNERVVSDVVSDLVKAWNAADVADDDLVLHFRKKLSIPISTGKSDQPL